MNTTEGHLTDIGEKIADSGGVAFDVLLRGPTFLVLGIILWFVGLSWWVWPDSSLYNHKSPYPPVIASIARKVGLSFTILYFYFGGACWSCDNLEHSFHHNLVWYFHGPFVDTSMLLSIDMLLFLAPQLYRRSMLYSSSTARPLLHSSSTERGEEKKTVKLTNKYMKLSKHLVEVVAFFVAQSLFIFLYCVNLDTDPDTHKGPKLLLRGGADISPGMLSVIWLASLMLQIFAYDTQMGNPVDWNFWVIVGERGAGEWGCTAIASFIIRWFMDVLINGLGYQIILFTFPIALLGSNGLGDFCKMQPPSSSLQR